MNKVITSVIALVASATVGLSAAQAGGYGHSTSHGSPSLVGANVNVGGVADVKANVGTTSRGGGSLLGLNVNTGGLLGNLLDVKADVGSTSSHGGSSLATVNANVGGKGGLLNANVGVGASGHQIENCEACNGGHEGGVGEW